MKIVVTKDGDKFVATWNTGTIRGVGVGDSFHEAVGALFVLHTETINNKILASYRIIDNTKDLADKIADNLISNGHVRNFSGSLNAMLRKIIEEHEE
jgi:hypothetical protein